MEFEKDAPVSDEQRHLAAIKKITLQPNHADITPEDVSESEIASSHINGQPLGSIYGNLGKGTPESLLSENTTSSSQSDTRKQSIKMISIIVGVALILIVASLLFVFAAIN